MASRPTAMVKLWMVSKNSGSSDILDVDQSSANKNVAFRGSSRNANRYLYQLNPARQFSRSVNVYSLKFQIEVRLVKMTSIQYKDQFVQIGNAHNEAQYSVISHALLVIASFFHFLSAPLSRLISRLYF